MKPAALDGPLFVTVIRIAAVAPALVDGGRETPMTKSSEEGPTTSAMVAELFHMFVSPPLAPPTDVVAAGTVAVREMFDAETAFSTTVTGRTNSTLPPGVEEETGAESPDGSVHVIVVPLAVHLLGTSSPVSRIRFAGSVKVTVVGPFDATDPPFATRRRNFVEAPGTTVDESNLATTLRSGRRSTNINMLEIELFEEIGSVVEEPTVAVEETCVPLGELSAVVVTFTTIDEPFCIGVELEHCSVVGLVPEGAIHVHVPAVDPLVVKT